MSEKIMERPLPQSPESERAVLGAILLDNRMLDTAMESVKAEYFFQDNHKRIFQCMNELQDERQAIDLITLSNALQKRNELESVGGASYISQLVDGIPKVSNVGYYAKEVTERYTLRQIIHTSHLMQEQAFEMHASASSVLESSTRAMVNLESEISTDNDGVTERDAGMKMMEHLDRQDVALALSGIKKLDDWTGGGQAGELWCYVAGTGVGKTIMVRQVANITCKSGWHTLYGSGEMYSYHLASKRIFADADVNPALYRFPKHISNDQRAALLQATSEQCTQCRILDGELTLSRIRTAARKMAKETKLGLVVGDYDQLIDSPGKNPLDKQNSLIRGMKSIAMENNCNSILISQFRKFLTPGQEPTLEDVFGSKGATAHATAVIYVSRNYVERLDGDETTAKIVVMKFRDGRICQIPAQFNVRKLRFEDAPDGTEIPRSTKKRAKEAPQRNFTEVERD